MNGFDFMKCINQTPTPARNVEENAAALLVLHYKLSQCHLLLGDSSQMQLSWVV